MKRSLKKSANAILPMVAGFLLLALPGRALEIDVRRNDSPATANTAEPNLAVAPGGRVYLTWIERRGANGAALKFSHRDGGTWSAPRTIVEADNLFVNWADFPSMVARSDGALVAHWLVRSGPDKYAYDVNIAISEDGGDSFGKPFSPHRDGKQAEHGFVSMVPLADRRVMVVWLDGRNFKSVEGARHGPSDNEMLLMYTIIDSTGKPSPEGIIDGRVCECCQTDAAMTDNGPLVVYRDRSKGEIRDISAVRFMKGRWSRPSTVHRDGWEIHGCPVNGPAVAAEGLKAAIAWFTAAADVPRVNLSFSPDGGETFGEPVRVDDGAPAGRVDVAMLDDGAAVVVWLERVSDGAEIRIRRVSPDGRRGESIPLTQSSVARSTGFPRMARVKDELVFAWTDPGQSPTVRTASMRVAALSAK